jgi:hypothetical protein
MVRLLYHGRMSAMVSVPPLREVRVDRVQASSGYGGEESAVHLGAMALVVCEA